MQVPELYGRVSITSAATSLGDKSNLRRRKNESIPDQPPGPANLNQIQQRNLNSNIHGNQNQIFRNNFCISLLIGIPIICMCVAVLNGLIPPTSSRSSALVLLIGSLVVYIFDLFNIRDGVIISIWVTFLLVSMSLLGDFVFGSGFDDDMIATSYLILPFLKLGISVFHLVCIAAWATLQLASWFSDNVNEVQFVVILEQLLFGVLPLSFSAITTYTFWLFTLWVPADYGFIDHLWIPHVFAILFSVSMWLIGNQSASFNDQNNRLDTEYSNNNKSKQRNYPSALRGNHAVLHAILLLLLPPAIHLTTMRYRLIFSFPSIHHIYDFFLTFTVPILLLTALKYNSISYRDFKIYKPNPLKKRKNNLQVNSFGHLHEFITNQLALVAIIVTVFISHEKYLIDMCTSVSLYIHGNSNSPFIINTYLIVMYASWLLCYCFKEDKIKFVGENAEDLFEIFIGVALFFAQKALGIPIQAIPALILAVLSITMFMNTRQFRYMIILAGAVGSQLDFLFLYRLGLASTFFASGISLNYFTTMCIVAIVLLIFTIGIVYRDPRGLLSSVKIDFAGIFLSSYSILLSFAETTLIQERDFSTAPTIQSLPLYPNYLPPITSTILLLIALNLKQTSAISPGSFLSISCIAVGKLFPAVIVNNKTHVFVHIAFISAILMTYFAPYAFLQPLSQTKVGKTSTMIQKATLRLEKTIFLYSTLVLPITILLSRSVVIEPLIYSISPQYQSMGERSLPFSTFVGWALSIWGFAVTSMTTYLLPNNGSESIKKAGVVSLFIGILTTFTTQKIPQRFKSLSIINEGTYSAHVKSRWGLVISILACLLALTGPLKFSDDSVSSRAISTRKQPLLVRVMIFSIIFGCGIAWFVALEIMGDANLVSTILTTGSCMVIAFLGTVLSVLAYSLDLQYISDVLKLANFAGFVFLTFLGVAGLSTWTEDWHLFGAGGWLSGYLSVCTLFALSICWALKLRNDENKNSMTRKLGNWSCIFSWSVCIFLVYGHYGVTRIGLSGIMSLIDSPAVIGTILASMILFLLEVDSSKRNAIKYRFPQQSPTSITIRSSITSVMESNMYTISITSIAAVLFLASLYAIFLRGCIGGGSNNIQTNYKDVFESVYGSVSRTTGVPGAEDVATMARKKFLYSKSMIVAARLAGSGFCTSEKIFGPLLHLCGIIAVLPSLFNLMFYLWLGAKKPMMQVIAVLPLNLLPLLVCNGIPTLQGFAFLGLLGGIFQLASMRTSYWKGRMQI